MPQLLGIILRGSYLASFFIFFCSFNVSGKTLEALSSDGQWRALLHIPETRSLILDSDFVFQGDHASIVALQQGIDALQSVDKQRKYLCRYPARSLWISEHYPSISFPDPLDVCDEFSRYIDNVPADKAVLVYAYENITQPASMMGHVFLKLEGRNRQGKKREHAVSFYTDTMTMNLPKLLFDSLVMGKQGFFIVSPYYEQLKQYNVIEQRNVMEYELKLSDYDRKLMHYHIWELKDVDMLYFFNKFNCATVTNNLVSVGDPSVLQASTDWLSPLDVVKESAQAGILSKPMLRASDSWKIRMLEETLKKQNLEAIDILQQDKEIDPFSLTTAQRFLFYSLDESYQNFLLSRSDDPRRVTTKESLFLADKWDIQEEQQFIQLSSYKDPLTRYSDSQFNVIFHENDELSIHYLPTSHQLSDDHRTSFSESELELLSVKGRFSTPEEKLKLEEIALYKMASFIPYDVFTGGFSKRFSIGAKEIKNEALSASLTPYMQGGAGITYSVHKDFSLYSMFSLQLEGHDGINVSYRPEIGFFLYGIYSLKTTASYSQTFNQLNSDSKIDTLKLDQTWFMNTDYSLILNYERQQTDSMRDETLSLEVRHYF